MESQTAAGPRQDFYCPSFCFPLSVFPPTTTLKPLKPTPQYMSKFNQIQVSYTPHTPIPPAPGTDCKSKFQSVKSVKSAVQFPWMRLAVPGILCLFAAIQSKSLTMNKLHAKRASC